MRSAPYEPTPAANRHRAMPPAVTLPGVFLGALLGALVLVARPAEAQQTAPAAPPSAEAQANSAQATLATADEVLQQMSRITGLPIKAPLKKELVSKSDVEQYLKDNLHAEYTAAEMHGEEAALKAFGVVPPDFSLERFLVSFYTEQAAGFYDPRRQTMFMADWVEPDQQKVVLAHELTHALQDQSFDLWKFTHAVRDNDDALTARAALVEGYATLSMMQVMLGSVPVEKLPSLDSMIEQGLNQSMASFPVYSSAPFFMRFQLLFPYLQGMRFSRRALEIGGWRRLNQTFTDPPSTTRQIFEPDLYFSNRPAPDGSNGSNPATAVAAQPQPKADELALPPPPSLEHVAGVQQVESNVMGALGYYALFGQLLTEAESRKVSSTWVADRYLVYEGPSPGQLILVSRTRWTSPKAAADFCADYRAILAKRSPGGDASKPIPQGGSASGDPNIFVRTSGSRRTLVLSKGDECRWFEGAPAEQADALGGWLGSLQ